MIESIALLAITHQIDRALRPKGLDPTYYQALAVALWIGLEITLWVAGVALALVQWPNLFGLTLLVEATYPLGLAGGLWGAALAWHWMRQALKAHTPQAEPTALPAAEPAGLPASVTGLPVHERYSLGVLFDMAIFAGGGFEYEHGRGPEALFFRQLDPDRLHTCTLYHGDTAATLNGAADQYCIRVDADDPEQIHYVHSVFAHCDHPALPPGHARFLTGAALAAEPLECLGLVDQQGALHTTTPLASDYLTGTGWWLYRQAHPAVPAERASPRPVEHLHLEPILPPRPYHTAFQAPTRAPEAREPGQARAGRPESDHDRSSG